MSFISKLIRGVIRVSVRGLIREANKAEAKKAAIHLRTAEHVNCIACSIEEMKQNIQDMIELQRDVAVKNGAQAYALEVEARKARTLAGNLSNLVG